MLNAADWLGWFLEQVASACDLAEGTIEHVLAKARFWLRHQGTALNDRQRKVILDIFWLRDESLADSNNLPPPEVIAQEIVEDLEAALEQFRLIAADLGVESVSGDKAA